MITVTITGKRGTGKTTTAIEIGRAMMKRGHEVKFKARTEYMEAAMMKSALYGCKALDLDVLIVDIDEEET